MKSFKNFLDEKLKVSERRITDIDVEQAKRDLEHAKLKKAKEKVQKEEVELDEISHKLARKAAASSAAKNFEYGSSAYGPDADKEMDRLDKKADKARAHVQKRQGSKGLKKVDRMTGKLIYGKSRAFEEVELDEADTYAIYKKGKVFDTFRSKEDAHDSLDSMGLSPISKKDYRVRKLPANHKNNWSMKEEVELDEDTTMQLMRRLILAPKMKKMVRFYLDWRRDNPGKGNMGVQKVIQMMGLNPRDGNQLIDTLNDLIKQGKLPKHLALNPGGLKEEQWGSDNPYKKYKNDPDRLRRILKKNQEAEGSMRNRIRKFVGSAPSGLKDELRDIEKRIKQIKDVMRESVELDELSPVTKIKAAIARGVRGPSKKATPAWARETGSAAKKLKKRAADTAEYEKKKKAVQQKRIGGS